MASLSRRINMISRCGASYRSKCSSAQLPGIYHSYVFAVSEHPGWSQDRLARHMCINKSNVTRHLAFLEENGYIRRTVSEEDKREMLVYPTDKMLGIRPEVEQITREWNAKITEDVSKEEFEQFMLVLEKMSRKAYKLTYGEEASV